MVSEKNLIGKHIDEAIIKKIAPESRIPVDTLERRKKFKAVPGIAKYLQKQFNAMVQREEAKVAQYNVGKLKDQKISLDQVIKPTFAYNEAAGQGAELISPM